MHSLDLILTLTGGLAAALVLGYVTQRVGLSPIVGYLLAGILVGPHTPGFVADTAMAEQLAEIGVILLMFGVGLQFHLEELLAVRRVALPGAILQSVVATALGWAVARAFGWDHAAGIVFGIALSVASTVVLIRVLADNRDLHTRSGHIAVGWLVVEDLFTVLVLVLLPSMLGDAATGSQASLGRALLITLLKVSALVAFTAIVGSRAIPWLLDRVAATRSRELFTLTVLVLALGIAVGAAKVFGVSMALGAFLAGMVVGRSEYSLRAASEALPMRDAFAVLFFVSVGMLLDPRAVLETPMLVLATLAVVLIGKPLVAFLVVRVMRYPLRVSLSVSTALAQIGEFSFILAALGRELGVLSGVAVNALVTAAIVSIVVNPLVYRALQPLEQWVARRPTLFRWLDGRGPRREDAAQDQAGEAALDARHRAVVVGYGPVGRTVTRLLRENGVAPAVIELNMDTVRGLRDEGLVAVYGDASKVDTLKAAGADRAASLILSADMNDSREVIRLARELNPSIRVLARAPYLHQRRDLEEAGANAVIAAEGEVALALTEAILSRLGATPEQMDRERSRVRAELVG
jgi:monovalent cation:H+ antiporter-2, CPA2 family